MSPHTQAVEDYLKAIYDLGRGEAVATSALAERLGVRGRFTIGSDDPMGLSNRWAHRNASMEQ